MPMKQFSYRRILSIFLCAVLLAGGMPLRVKAEPVAWPDNVSISAEGGIVMDADSGVILYGKNMHNTYYPASITKILTALLIIENFDLDDTVTFSHNAVFNVEPGSTSAGLDVGDTLTVRDCLYAMLLKSANEVANALAEYASGSIEAFAAVMNAKAKSLGCTDSHFNNPSGLNDPDHYTSAHDMALIAQAAFRNEIFTEIDSTLYYDLPPTKRNPEGFRIYPGHRMMKKNMPQYYAGIIGGKTGYTSLAGNTLVTCAQRDGVKLIAVVLNGHSTHYVDTKALLDFGFRNFQSLDAADYDTTYTSVTNDMTIAGLPTTDLSVLRVQDDCRITLPVGANFSDAVSTITYDLPEDAPPDAIAQISYQYGDRQVGSTYLVRNREKALPLPAAELPLNLPEPEETEAAAPQETRIANMAEGIASPLAGLVSSGSSEDQALDPENAAGPEDSPGSAGIFGKAGGAGRGNGESPDDTGLSGMSGGIGGLGHSGNADGSGSSGGAGDFGRSGRSGSAGNSGRSGGPGNSGISDGADGPGRSGRSGSGKGGLGSTILSLPGRILGAFTGFVRDHAGILLALGGLLLAAVAVFLVTALRRHIREREKAERALRYQRRQQRLQDIGVSTEEFDLILSERRSGSLQSPRRRFSGRRRHKSFLDSKRLR